MKEVRVAALVEQIKPLLAGQDPYVQVVALADLCAIWLAGHPPHQRAQMLELQIEMIKHLITVNERLFFGTAGHPATRHNN